MSRYTVTEHRLTVSCPTCEEGFSGDRIVKREPAPKPLEKAAGSVKRII